MGLSRDVVVLPASDEGHPDRWIAYNVFTRTSLGTDSAGLGLLAGNPAAGRAAAWDVEWFSHFEGTMADPTRLRRPASAWGEPRTLAAAEFLALCRRHWLLVDDEAAYRARFRRKVSVLDRDAFGNFHDQMGHHLLVERRTQPARWWLEQKFVPALDAVRSDNAYGRVQARYLEGYFPRRFGPGARVLDLGCGIGFFSNMMARAGCEVVGVDPNADYIAAAREKAVPGARFECLPVGNPGDLDGLEGGFDFVFMQDALLFYFVPVSRADGQDLKVLLADVRRLLKPDGRFVSVEPNAAFYLAPWLGAPSAPFTVVTEHRDRRFSTVPALAELVKAVLQGGFVLAGMDDLYDDAAGGDDGTEASRGAAFARQFPLWGLLEFQPSPAHG